MRAPTGRPPPPPVLTAFGAIDEPIELSGGFDGAWRSGDIVLKPSRSSLPALEAEASVLASTPDSGFRLQRARRASDGSLLVGGWIARDYLEGRTDPTRCFEIVAVADALHDSLAAVSHEAAAPMVMGRVDPWGRADRIAWDEEPLPGGAGFEADPLPRLAAARLPVASASQLVHGDLSGNVLFAQGELPGVIDFSPYFRPPQWALGVVVADSVVWSGAGLDLLDAVADRADAGQCLVRAILFRHVTGILLERGAPSGAAAARYAALVEAALRLAATT